jgi:hypothetical protein
VSAASRVGEWLYAKLSGFPREWTDPGRLAGWQAGHADPTGDVWCVTPPCPEWELYAPGAFRFGDAEPFQGVEPVASSSTDAGDVRVWLVDLEPWMRPWIEQETGGVVVEMVEGVLRVGPDGLMSDYVIFAQVTR